MAPKHRIRTKVRTHSGIDLSTNRIRKRKIRGAPRSDSHGGKKEHSSSKRRGGPAQEESNSRGIADLLPARGPGRPTHFDKTEEEFLRNVPEQLKQYAFRPGHKGLPGAGRPKGAISLTTRLRGLLATEIEGRSHPRGKAAVTYADELMALALQAARRGDYRFFEHIYSRVEGKIPDHVVIEEVQRMVAQESEKLTEKLVKIVSSVVDEELGEKRGQIVVDKLTARITEQLGEKDAGRRAG